MEETFMHVQAYLSFEGRCEEALEFYRKALDAEIAMLMRFEENPEQPPAPGTERKVLHAELRIGESVVMASDGMCRGPAQFQGVALTLAVADDAEAKHRFAALADGGAVQMPLGKTFFASSFGVARDRFGVEWMVIAPPA
jgi:PhnB protein